MDAVAPSPRPLRAIPRGLLRLRSDAVLGDRAAAGDESAFAVLYERHHALVLAICIGVLGSHQDAEDASQEAFAALMVSLRKHPPRELRPWLVRVSRNAAIDLARRRRAHPPLGEGSVDPRSLGAGIKQELDSVLAGLRELPESQRTALLLRELAGHSYNEIATMLNTDQRAVRGLIARARIGLRNYREAIELPCTVVRAALAVEPDGRRRDKAVRRHLRTCNACQAYRDALRSDAKALRALAPAPVGGLASGGAAAGLAAKGVLVGGTLSQVGAVCSASVCSVGGFVMLYEHGAAHRVTTPRAGAPMVRKPPALAHARVEAASVHGAKPSTAHRAAPGAVAARRQASHTRAGTSVSLTRLDRHRPRHAGAAEFSPGRPVRGITRPVGTQPASGSSPYGADHGAGSGRNDAGSAGGWSAGRQGTWPGGGGTGSRDGGGTGGGDAGARDGGRAGGGETGAPAGGWTGSGRGSGAASGQTAPDAGVQFDSTRQGAGSWGQSGQPGAGPGDETQRTPSWRRDGSGSSWASGGSGSGAGPGPSAAGGSAPAGGWGSGGGSGFGGGADGSGSAATPGGGSGSPTNPGSDASAPASGPSGAGTGT